MLFHITPAALADGYGEDLVPLALVKSWCRVEPDFTDDDFLLEALRDAAIDMVEKTGNLRMGPQTGLTAVFESFGPGMRIGGGLGEPLAVTAISYADGAGADQAIADAGWRVDAGKSIVPAIGTCWPRVSSSVTVTFDAGYPAGACPGVLKTATLMFAAYLYSQREAVIEGTMVAEAPLGVIAQIDRCRLPVI